MIAPAVVWLRDDLRRAHGSAARRRGHAAPYFRVFNTRLQADRFDGAGRYVRRWVPEAGSPEYPDPIVDLAASRRRALAAYDELKRGGPR